MLSVQFRRCVHCSLRLRHIHKGYKRPQRVRHSLLSQMRVLHCTKLTEKRFEALFISKLARDTTDVDESKLSRNT